MLRAGREANPAPLFFNGMEMLAISDSSASLVMPDGRTLHIHVCGSVNPNSGPCFEATARQFLLKPAVHGLGWARVLGITFEHAGNGLPADRHGCGGHYFATGVAVRRQPADGGVSRIRRPREASIESYSRRVRRGLQRART